MCSPRLTSTNFTNPDNFAPFNWKWKLFRSWVCRYFRCDARVNGSWATRIVDDVKNFSVFAQAYRDHVMKLHVRTPGNFNGAGQHHARLLEDAVDSKPPRFVPGDIVGYLVGCPALRIGALDELAGREREDLTEFQTDKRGCLPSPFHRTWNCW